MDFKNVKPSLTVFAFIFPFWSMIASIKYFKSPVSRNLFWFGCAFMGFVFVFNPIRGSGSDGVRYAAQLVEMHNAQLNFDVFSQFLYSQGGELDIYQGLVTFIV